MEFPAVPAGLVGGHCIGVDRYYLTHKAEQLGYFPEAVLLDLKRTVPRELRALRL